jgi:hypothetical protein
MNKCKNKAEIAIPWAGEIKKGCRDHAHAMTVLGNFIGTPLLCRELPPNADDCEFMDDLK